MYISRMAFSGHLLVLLLLPFLDLAAGQRTGVAPPVSIAAPAPAPDIGCNGIYLSYVLQSRQKIRPFVDDPSKQPYAFSAMATVLNSYVYTLKAWELIVQFEYEEILVTVDGAILTNGDDLPYNTTFDGGNGTFFSGYPQVDLLTPIATAGNLAEIQAQIAIVGTLFDGPKGVPLPSSLNITDPAFVCPPVVRLSNLSNFVSTCCTLNPDFENTTIVANISDPSKLYKNRTSGDLTITYDVLQSYPSSYLALVTMENHALLARLDNWHLTWQWQREEFIHDMKGAYPLEVDTMPCIYGPQAKQYAGLDFSQVLNCQRKPVILDLPPQRYNDTQIGRIQHCCRNGTILPKTMDPSQSISSFMMNVYKMPPDLNITTMYPPTNFKIAGSSSLNPDFVCGPPVRVSPTQFPNPSGLDSTSFAVATWQIVCNISQTAAKPKCCVSFSAFYNTSVVPCNTCACGCPPTKKGSTCNTTAPAVLLPPQSLLVPFDNRTQEMLAWAKLEHFNVPNPMPCGDFCGVSINWQIATDYTSGWSARMTLFNWEKENMADWFAAVVLDKAYNGYQQMYSFNGTAVGNDTVFIVGLSGLNYLMGETNISGSSYLVPGKQQSVISFTKKHTPGINIVAGDGYPSKVYFNGDECAMPDVFLISGGFRARAAGVVASVLAVAFSSLLLLQL